MGSYSAAVLEGGHTMMGVSRILGILVAIGLTNGDQSVYPATNGVAPLAQEYPDTGLVDNNAYYNQGEYSQGGYDYTQYSDTDRTAELIESAITIPMAITAFLAALLGGIMSPVVGDGMRALMEFELPEFELPRIKKSGSGRNYEDIYKPVSSLFKIAAEKIVTNALERLHEAQ